MQAWKNFVEAQETDLGVDTVQKWLRSLKVLKYDAGNLYLEAKDAFQAMWFEEHIRHKLRNKLLNNNNRRIKVHLSIANVPTKVIKNKLSKTKPESVGTPPSFDLSFDELDPTCHFNYFVVSDSNQLTYKLFGQIEEALKDKSDSKNSFFNPIYVHGGIGAGKTHLLMATATLLRQQGFHVIYSRAQTFTDHVVSAIRAGEMSIFRQTYRNSDVLIIDDVHVFSRKGATQEEFFHTFNSLHVAGKQIILSANCPPGELQLIEPRLVSRFEWGIVLSLEQATREETLKILNAKCIALNFPLHPKVTDFLVDSFSNMKSVNKALEALILRSHLNQGAPHSNSHLLTVIAVKQMLADLLLEEKQSALTAQGILQGVAEFFGIRVEDILGKAQTREYVLPRQIAMHVCRHQLKMPYVKIGDLFGKDHSTVMSSVKLIQKNLGNDDPEIASAHRSILKKLSHRPD
jgi:chromosomal replication initiator protein